MPNANTYITDLSPYQPGMPVEQVAREYGLDPDRIVKLASNENPLGPSPLALDAFTEALQRAHRYPEHYELTAKLVQGYGVASEQLVLGNGSNDVIDLIARTYLGTGDEAIMSQYAFAMYSIAVQSVGAKHVVVPARNYGHDLAAMRAAITPRTRVVWIANPNNPTGTFIPYSDIARFLDEVSHEVIVVLDEAYYEYLKLEDQSATHRWPEKYPNLVVLRTFSKIYGLAGMRVGYGITSPGVAQLLNRVRLPFNLSGPSMAAAVAALDDKAFTQRSYALNYEQRARLLTDLENLGIVCMPAYGNFVTFRLDNAAEVCKKLLTNGVVVRPLTAYDLRDWLRVSVGLPDENKHFLSTLHTILEGMRE